MPRSNTGGGYNHPIAPMGTLYMRIYLLSTAVAPLGSGLGGGVEHMVITAARQLHAEYHRKDTGLQAEL